MALRTTTLTGDTSVNSQDTVHGAFWWRKSHSVENVFLRKKSIVNLPFSQNKELRIHLSTRGPPRSVSARKCPISFCFPIREWYKACELCVCGFAGERHRRGQVVGLIWIRLRTYRVFWCATFTPEQATSGRRRVPRLEAWDSIPEDIVVRLVGSVSDRAFELITSKRGSVRY